jgi:hypothetical protein
VNSLTIENGGIRFKPRAPDSEFVFLTRASSNPQKMKGMETEKESKDQGCGIVREPIIQ